ncbi:response regulator [Parabacteroides segnis]|uniref:hybrid sensor histidine kinase/response regulator transcription factor n=1 Tax=Parabacteroides segnis TaxID=2763058 RepID=UPI0035131256
MLAIKKCIYLCFFSFYYLAIANAVPEYYFKQISLKEGLSESKVKCVLTDHKGLIWIGTHFGLNSFDGERVKKYYNDKQDVYSIPNNDICFLVEDSLQNLWVSTEHGLALYNREKDHFIPILFEGRLLNVHAYLLVKDGLLLFGRGEFYKYSYDDRKIMPLPFHCEEDIQTYYERACVYDGSILLASRWNGLWEYNIRTGYLRLFPLINDSRIAALFIDSSGYLWLSVYGKGLLGYDFNRKQIAHLDAPGKLSNGVVLDIKEREGKLWLATDGGGINIYDKTTGEIEVINHIAGKASSLPASSFCCLYNDPDNNMWAGSIRGGLIGMKEVYLKTYQEGIFRSAYGLSEKTVVGTYEDDEGMIWLGTDGGGLNRLDPRTEQINHYPSTYSSKIVSIINYSQTKLLYSSFGKGLFLFDKRTGQIREYTITNKKKHNKLFESGKSTYLLRLDDNRFYLLGDSVYLYDQSAEKLITVQCRDTGLPIFSLLEISKGTDKSYLCGGSDLFELDYTSNTMRAIYSSNYSLGKIAAACRDDQGHFWIGSTDGLFRYDPIAKKLEPIENNRFLGVTSLSFDHRGHLWVGTHNGLYAYTPADKKIMMFGESDGVYANEFVSKSPLLTRGGDLYIAGVIGLVYIKNNIPLTENQDLTVALLDVVLDGASVSAEADRNDNKISVPWNYTSLIAKVIVRENDLMRKKLLRYYIKGTQEEVLESTNHTIAFHALSTGNYEVWASCNKKNGDWSEPVRLLTVEVMPPWWRTSSFIIACVLFVLAGVSFAFWVAMKKQKNKMLWVMEEHKQQTYEEKIRFLINLNHELRTPLTLIYSPLKRLLNSGEITNPSHSKLLTDVQKQVRRVKDIINMILDVRKMETGGEILHIGLYNLNEWLQLVSDTFKSELEYKHIQLEYGLEKEVREVSFDAAKCEIILSNLIMNALKYSDEGTTITISSRLEQGYARVLVSDEGIGLANVDMTRLFDRFYQGEHGRNGSGIGLSYSRLLVEMHGGHIGVMNNAGKGVTFYYELPLNNTTTLIAAKPYLNELLVSPEMKMDMITDFSVRKYSILIVEDEPELRDYLKSSLKEYFKQVYMAKDGVEAFDMVVHYLPDIVVSDVMMPCMDGFEFCRKLKGNLEISHIPVVLLTARVDQDSTIQGYKEGADFYLPKPFDLEFLLAIVRNLLKNREAVKLRYKDSKEITALKEDTISNADEVFMKKLNELIGGQLENPDLDVNYVATQMAMSRASLYNKLKALTDISIGDYINKFRMTRVMELLADKNLSILEVSEKAGFTNQRYFSTVFKQAYGTTPSKYRQEHFS